MFTPEVIAMTVLVFFALVGIHEWGHYYFAKRVGILVREFALGFGPRLFSYKKGETRYTLRIFPIGGFVRMAGEDPEIVPVSPGQTIAVEVSDGVVRRIFLDRLEERTNALRGAVQRIDLERDLSLSLETDEGIRHFAVDPKAIMAARGSETQIAPLNRQFAGKTAGQKAITIFAGPMMNFVLSFVLFLVYVMGTGVPDYVKLAAIEENSPAAKAGLMPGDVITAVNGEPIGADMERLVALIGASAGREMIFSVRRDGEDKLVPVKPETVDGTGKVGISIVMGLRKAGPLEAVGQSAALMWDFTKEIFFGLRMLLSLQLGLDDLGGPVRIVEVTGQVASMGVISLVLWSAMLSLYLGIFNLLPFPALDGSRLMFIGIEAIRGRPVDPARESMVHFIGFAMLMMLMIAVTYNDILRLFKG